MKTLVRFLIVSFTLFSLAGGCFAWNEHGHLLVSSVAYRVLRHNNSPAFQKINIILRSHPAFPEWRNEYMHGSFELRSALTLEGYVFIRAAAWPDDVRSPPGNPEHHPTWHFINFPLMLPATIDFNVIDPPHDNIFEALDLAVQTIGSTTQPNQEKAKKVSWILHLVGDVHQPLHTVALKNAFFPQGDRGGNLECVLPPGATGPEKLHSYWDGLTGAISNKSDDILQAYAESNYLMFREDTLNAGTFNLKFDMKLWASESAKLALSNAYQFKNVGIIMRKVDASSACPQFQASDALSDDYEGVAKVLALKRILMAGYRLAGGLQQTTIP